MGAVIRVDGGVWKTVMPSENSCQPQGDLFGAGGRDGRAVDDCTLTGAIVFSTGSVKDLELIGCMTDVDTGEETCVG